MAPPGVRHELIHHGLAQQATTGVRTLPAGGSAATVGSLQEHSRTTSSSSGFGPRPSTESEAPCFPILRSWQYPRNRRLKLLASRAFWMPSIRDTLPSSSSEIGAKRRIGLPATARDYDRNEGRYHGRHHLQQHHRRESQSIRTIPEPVAECMQLTSCARLFGDIWS